MDRRAFLRHLLALPAVETTALAVDWERLLWTPRAMITVPAMTRRLSLTEIDGIVRQQIMPGLVDNYFKASPLLAFLKNDAFHAKFHRVRPIHANLTWDA